MSQMTPDPSLSVQHDVLPHLHLLSNHKYPTRARIEIAEAARWLREAPQVADHKAAFYWTCLDRPVDGTTHLVWQPLQRCGVAPATDGYIWATPEQLYQQDIGGGVVLEMYYHRAGYAFGEPMTSHSRRRFRLVSAPNSQTPTNPSLWLIHWGASEPAERLPTSQFPPQPKLIKALEARAPLRLLSRKDFMLRDHSHWPTITRDNNPQAPPQMSMPRMPPQMAYQPPPVHTQVQFAPVPAQRKARGQQAAEDEEDVRGDFFDAITPRDIALERYKRSHDWIEEVVASHYSMSQIIPPDLGLERTGPLAKLVDGILINPNEIDKARPPTTQFRPGALEELRKRVDEYVGETEKEILEMEAKHRLAMDSLVEGGIFKKAERMLRENDANTDEIVAMVEGQAGQKVEDMYEAQMVEPGGYTKLVEPRQTPSDVVMDGAMGVMGHMAPPGAGFAPGPGMNAVPGQNMNNGHNGQAMGIPQQMPQPTMQPQQPMLHHQPPMAPPPPDDASLGFDAGNDFGDLNTAGEELDNYGGHSDMGMGMDMDMNSFGDAFTSGMSANASVGHAADM